MAFAGIDEEFGQYDSSLPDEVKAVPVGGFPKEAHQAALAKSQQKFAKKREEEKARGERKMEFVPSNTSAAGKVAEVKGLKGSASERVMAGLDREKSRSPQVSDSGKRREPEQRRSRFDDRQGRKRERSRSPRR